MSNPKDEVTYLSLGHNCFFKRYCDDVLKLDRATHFFDYLGASMWSVELLFENDFSDLNCVEDYQMCVTKKNISTLTHKKYYLRFRHDFPNERAHCMSKTEHTWRKKKIIQKYRRRAERLTKLLKESKKICFLRHEETMHDRKVLPHDSKYRKSEFEHLCRLDTLLRAKYPHLECKFVLLSATKPKPEHLLHENIQVVDFSEHYSTTNWRNCTEKIDKVLCQNLPFQ